MFENAQTVSSGANDEQPQRSGVPVSVAFALMAIMTIAAFFAFYFAQRSPSAEQQIEIERQRTGNVQLELAKKQADFQLECQRNDAVLRQQIIKTCLSKGMIPELAAGNIYCRSVK